MSQEAFDDTSFIDHKDSVLYMMMRRVINEEYAQCPVDFNAAGLKAGELVLQRALSSHDVIVDLGSSSGEMIAEAAIATDTQARIICVEPDKEAGDAYLRLPDTHSQRVSFVHGIGEDLPFRTSSVQGLTLHNVIFRAQDAAAMMTEVKRVVEPGGYVAISSNAQGHAFYRHEFERRVAEKVILMTGEEFSIPEPPADGHYISNLPALIEQTGDLTILNHLYVEQKTHAVITPGERLENYLDSIKFSAANTDLPAQHRSTWRQVVDSWVKPYIEARIAEAAEDQKNDGQASEPYFADTINRGMFVLLNQKSR